MKERAASFMARVDAPGRAARALAGVLADVRHPSGALIFASGSLSARLVELGRELKAVLGDTPAMLAVGHGVLTERGEIEHESAIAGIVWSGGTTECVGVPSSEGDLGYSLARSLDGHAQRAATAFAFVRAKGFLPHMLEPLREQRFACMVGAGTAGEVSVVPIAPGLPLEPAAAGALILKNLTPPTVKASPGCRLLSKMRRITRVRGGMVLELDGYRALEALSEAANGLTDQLLFVALAEHLSADDPPALLLRGIQGVDPLQHGVLVSDEVRAGQFMAFAVRNAEQSRIELEQRVARLARDAGGARPHFGVYVSCAGRGRTLYGSEDVDTRIIRARFPQLPLAGMHSSFEIAPHGGGPALQLYTGVLTVFTEPS
ncbi:MAG TPA: FIST C-terminal domain-containing protein [Polyangiaceae bacterium]|nr:FIST C-terminal domain-containing protein [Polyangiaceae bacterium]